MVLKKSAFFLSRKIILPAWLFFSLRFTQTVPWCIIFRAVPHRRPPSHSPFDFIDCKFFRLLSDRHDCHIVSFHKMPIYDPSVKFDNIPICFSWTEKGNLRPSTCLPFLSIFSRPASELFGKIGTEVNAGEDALVRRCVREREDRRSPPN